MKSKTLLKISILSTILLLASCSSDDNNNPENNLKSLKFIDLQYSISDSTYLDSVVVKELPELTFQNKSDTIKIITINSDGLIHDFYSFESTDSNFDYLLEADSSILINIPVDFWGSTIYFSSKTHKLAHEKYFKIDKPYLIERSYSLSSKSKLKIRYSIEEKHYHLNFTLTYFDSESNTSKQLTGIWKGIYQTEIGSEAVIQDLLN